jgi:hypothetical protein
MIELKGITGLDITIKNVKKYKVVIPGLRQGITQYPKMRKLCISIILFFPYY